MRIASPATTAKQKPRWTTTPSSRCILPRAAAGRRELSRKAEREISLVRLETGCTLARAASGSTEKPIELLARYPAGDEVASFNIDLQRGAVVCVIDDQARVR